MLSTKKGGARKRYLDGTMFFDIKASDRVSQVVSSLSTQVASLEDSCQEVQQLKESVDKYKELLKTESSGKAVNQGKLYRVSEEA